MPRPNQPRTIGAEARLIERVEHLQQLRGWSDAQLARAVTATGCSLTQSAIFKSRHADPPRRITLDEAVGFAKALDCSVSSLIDETPLEALRSAYMSARQELALTEKLREQAADKVARIEKLMPEETR